MKAFRNRRKRHIKSFKYFSELPSELRLSIWELALPGPCIIKISYSTDKFGNLKIQTESRKALSSLNLACKESHFTVKAFYEDYYHCSIGRTIRFNNEADFLYIPDTMTLEKFVYSGIHNRSNARNSTFIKRLAVYMPFDFMWLPPPGGWEISFQISAKCGYKLLWNFEKLEHITFVRGTECITDHILQADVEWLLKEFREEMRSGVRRMAVGSRENHDASVWEIGMLDKLDFRIVRDFEFPASIPSWPYESRG